MDQSELKPVPVLFTPLMVKALHRLTPKTETRRRDRAWLRVKQGRGLWVRETWAADQRFNEISPNEMPVCCDVWYYAGGQKFTSNGNKARRGLHRGRWRPNLHMPAWAARTKLEATADAYAQKLHAMTDGDALAEGIMDLRHFGLKGYGLPEWERSESFNRPRDAFKHLWNKLHPEEPWANNPELVVVPFKEIR